MHNFSSVNTSYSNNTLAQTGNATGGLGRHRARVLVQVAATLSTLSPGRATSRAPSKRRAAPLAPLLQTASATDQLPRETRRSGTRVRTSGRCKQRAEKNAAAQKPPSEPQRSKASKNKKTGKAQDLRPAGGRMGSGSSAGSRRQQRRSEALDDFAVVRHRTLADTQQLATDQTVSHRRGRRQAGCTGPVVPLGQDNFTRIHQNPDGCYRLVETVVITDGDALPVGNRTHPFTGNLNTDDHKLSVQLTRQQGDAVVFGAISNSILSLSVTDSRVETLNGSKAALIGEMRSGNRVQIRQLRNSLFNATGEGSVEAGLVASTRGPRNSVNLNNATDNQVLAYARSSTGSRSRTALASLGLGTVAAAGSQYINQRELRDNRVQALVGERQLESGEKAGNTTQRSSAALLGMIDSSSSLYLDLTSRQTQLHNNFVIARTEQPQHSGANGTGFSCASLGYASRRCREAPLHLNSWKRLDISQADCVNNSVQAWSIKQADEPEPQSPIDASGLYVPAGLARSSLVSTDILSHVRVRHRAVGPDQLEATGNHTDRFLLAPATRAGTLLFSGGDGQLPLFPSWARPQLEIGGCMIDTAGYQASSFAFAPLPEGSVGRTEYSSLELGDWPNCLTLFYTAERYDGRDCLRLATTRYPHESLQSLVRLADGGWVLVTRQRYPWKQENDLNGLLRISHFLPPGLDDALPRVDEPRRRQKDYLPRKAEFVLQPTTPVYSLAHGNQLHQLYHGSGYPIQVVSLILERVHSNDRLAPYHFQLAQYDLPGQARLLSVENKALNLWMQDANDTLMAYQLMGYQPETGARPDMSPPVRRGYDLSDQPGGLALLARAGNWLYSLRQQDDQPASLRRLSVSTGIMDADWQPVWAGNLTEGLRLIAGEGQLTALPAGTQVNPAAPDSGIQPQVPELGGCLQWTRTTLERHVLTRTSLPVPSSTSPSSAPTAAPTAAPTLPSSAPTTAVTATAAQATTAGITTALATGSVAGAVIVGAAVGVASSCLCFLLWSKHRQRQASTEEHRILLQAAQTAEEADNSSQENDNPIENDSPGEGDRPREGDSPRAAIAPASQSLALEQVQATDTTEPDAGVSETAL